jgi:hypothetical protein
LEFFVLYVVSAALSSVLSISRENVALVWPLYFLTDTLPRHSRCFLCFPSLSDAFNALVFFTPRLYKNWSDKTCDVYQLYHFALCERRKSYLYYFPNPTINKRRTGPKVP